MCFVECVGSRGAGMLDCMLLDVRWPSHTTRTSSKSVNDDRLDSHISGAHTKYTFTVYRTFFFFVGLLVGNVLVNDRRGSLKCLSI